MRWIPWIMLSVVLALAAGCGKKGALYLPENAATAKPAATAPAEPKP
ncbi:MAG TPA: hypothetical protein VGA00_02770 [Acidiferrobacterales bacterium]|jgi:predicted small lipoprotein YifL